MSNTITANIDNTGLLVTGTLTNGQIVYTITLPSGKSYGGITGNLIDVGTLFRGNPITQGVLTFRGQAVITTDDQADIAAMKNLIATLGDVEKYMEGNLTAQAQEVPTEGNPLTDNDPTGPGKTDPATVSDPSIQGNVDDDNIENSEPQTVDATEDPGTNTADDDNEETVDNRNPASVGEDESSPYGTDYQAKGEPVLSEDGTPSGFLRNPETGDLYRADGEQVGGQEEPDASPDPSSRGLFGAQQNARTEASAQDQSNFAMKEDWRVRLSLAPGANYLYKAPDVQGILAPLASTDGVIFPYTPNIQVGYSAAYDATSPTHSNYKIYQYTNSSVDNISITCDFTAQDTFEANYLLAVIHFFRTLTKMFYGQDQNPKPGTPPPLVFLYGLGAFQFNAHPLVVTNFNYNLPNDVDYIRAAVTTTLAGVNKSVENPRGTNTNTSGNRLGSGILPGGVIPPTTFGTVPGGTVEPTYVPTKMQIQISALPIITRNQISNAFSLKDYATGKLLQGTKRAGGGIW